MDNISGERAAGLFKGATRELRVVLLLHSANVRVKEVRLLSLQLQVSQQRKQQKAFVCLYRLSHLVILGEWFGNTGLEVSVMGERWGRCGCKDCLHRVKGLWAMGVRP